MAASCDVKILAKVDGLGEFLTFLEAFSTTAPVKAVINRQVQTTTDVAEALNLCGITTVELIIVKATSKAVSIDTTYVASFVAEVKIAEGKVAIFQPAGTVYVKNTTALDTCTFDVMIIGTA
jgi:hypothetical protein